MRYSKKNVEIKLQEWIIAVHKNGMYNKKVPREVGYDLVAVDGGVVFAAEHLLKVVKSCNKIRRQQFVEMLIAKRDIAATLPVNSNHFTNLTGYAQVKNTNTTVCFEYGEYIFNTGIVFSIFSEFYDIISSH